ncbi:NADH dehydrogenase [Eggerthella sp. YY7918]|nr:NADH dehydrogenase [Eggerthella sp. YY7918]
MPSITIDGIAVQVAEGSTILDAAQAAGISIPTLCFLKERSAIGSCRVCVVDVEGEDYPVPSCTTVVREGMVISTDSPRITAYRRIALDLIASDVAAGGACETCSSDEWGELGELCRTYG